MKWGEDELKLIELSVTEFSELAGGSVATWSRRFSGDRDIKVSSLVAPARALGMTPGELLDIILERRRRYRYKAKACSNWASG